MKRFQFPLALIVFLHIVMLEGACNFNETSIVTSLSVGKFNCEIQSPFKDDTLKLSTACLIREQFHTIFQDALPSQCFKLTDIQELFDSCTTCNTLWASFGLADSTDTSLKSLTLYLRAGNYGIQKSVSLPESGNILGYNPKLSATQDQFLCAKDTVNLTFPHLDSNWVTAINFESSVANFESLGRLYKHKNTTFPAHRILSNQALCKYDSIGASGLRFYFGIVWDSVSNGKTLTVLMEPLGPTGQNFFGSNQEAKAHKFRFLVQDCAQPPPKGCCCSTSNQCITCSTGYCCYNGVCIPPIGCENQE